MLRLKRAVESINESEVRSTGSGRAGWCLRTQFLARDWRDSDGGNMNAQPLARAESSFFPASGRVNPSTILGLTPTLLSRSITVHCVP
jgi:hypothetical protein